MRTNGSITASPRSTRNVVSAPQTTNLADLLERVLDKGLVIAGDLTLFLGGVELLTLRIRLLVASIDKAQEIGINWWQFDPALSSRASARVKELEQTEQERNLLTERLDRLERMLLAPPQEADLKRSATRQRSNAASGYALDPEGRVIAELKPLHAHEQPLTQNRAPQPVQQLHKEEPPYAPEQASQPGAVQAEQLAGAGQLLGPALHERMVQAMRPILDGLRQRNMQDPQPVEQTRPAGQRGEEQPQEAVQNAAPARVLEEEGRIIAELEQLVQLPPQEEWPQVLELAEEPASEQIEQPAGGGPLLGPALHERMAQAIQPVLEGLRQRSAQASQLVEQARHEGQQKRWHATTCCANASHPTSSHAYRKPLCSPTWSHGEDPASFIDQGLDSRPVEAGDRQAARSSRERAELSVPRSNCLTWNYPRATVRMSAAEAVAGAPLR